MQIADDNKLEISTCHGVKNIGKSCAGIEVGRDFARQNSQNFRHGLMREGRRKPALYAIY